MPIEQRVIDKHANNIESPRLIRQGDILITSLTLLKNENGIEKQVSVQAITTYSENEGVGSITLRYNNRMQEVVSLEEGKLFVLKINYLGEQASIFWRIRSVGNEVYASI
jgi:hypothetical protein